MKHKITIPEPCNENWDKMTPNENGRFCLSCSKTVIDFTLMLPEEIQHFFIQNQNNKICGRFKKSQLETITIEIPSRVLYEQTHYPKIFLLALFVIMGTTLFSCQDKDGNKKKIDKIEVVEKDAETPNITVGVTLPPKHDPKETLKVVPPPPPPPKVDHVKFVKNPVNIGKKDNSSNIESKKALEEPIYNGGIAIETNAEFPGGIEQFYNFFEKEFKKPVNPESNNLKINLSFAVERNGTVSYLQSIPEVDTSTQQEIARVLSLCPKWQPGEMNGKKVRRLYSLPITLH